MAVYRLFLGQLPIVTMVDLEAKNNMVRRRAKGKKGLEKEVCQLRKVFPSFLNQLKKWKQYID